jgi:hypothetical protein
MFPGTDPGEPSIEGPRGFQYRADFITPSEESALLEAIGGLAFEDFTLRGVVAKRRVAFFGESYTRAAAEPIPGFLEPLRAAIAKWTGVEPDAFAMALVNEYRPGAPIGIATRRNTTSSAACRCCRRAGWCCVPTAQGASRLASGGARPIRSRCSRAPPT